MEDSMPTIELQPWTTLTSWTGLALSQELDQSVDTSGYRTAVLQAMVLCACDCTLTIGGGEALGFSEVDHASYASGYSDPQLVYLSKDDPYGATTRLLRYIGWRVKGTRPWKVCFRLVLTLK